MPQLLRIEEPQRAPRPLPPRADKSDVYPLWRLGFRPFFLFGVVFSLFALALWIGFYAGWTPAPATWEPLGGWLSWHRHEMPFGFATAIVAGFLLTAIQNWTSRPSLSGKPLLGLFALWALARLAWLVGAPWPVAAAPELAFLLLLAFATGRLLWRARQSHNYSAPFTIVMMAAADALSIAGLATVNDDWQRNGALAVVWLIVALMTMIGGRVIPFFTQRGLGRAAPRPAPLWLDATLMAAALVLALLSAFGLGATASLVWVAPFALLAVAHAWRLWRWHDRDIWRVPLLWSLHLACLWLAVALAAFALFHAGWLTSSSIALHALTVGAMSGLILAMIARVSLGHTGRPLQASGAMTWAFALLNLGAAARVFVAPYFFMAGLAVATVCWLAAFGIFAWRYAPILLAPRADGKPG
ncbi:MAG: NnrS family protein [Azoarcus sp.]|jgi:uncharacterized protein involved in response to NO|nr:NnrS family protein [Azoarcus sp.]